MEGGGEKHCYNPKISVIALTFLWCNGHIQVYGVCHLYYQYRLKPVMTLNSFVDYIKCLYVLLTYFIRTHTIIYGYKNEYTTFQGLSTLVIKWKGVNRA